MYEIRKKRKKKGMVGAKRQGFNRGFASPANPYLDTLRMELLGLKAGV